MSKRGRTEPVQTRSQTRLQKKLEEEKKAKANSKGIAMGLLSLPFDEFTYVSSDNSAGRLDFLPTDLFIHTANYFQTQDCVALARTCRHMRVLFTLRIATIDEISPVMKKLVYVNLSLKLSAAAQKRGEQNKMAQMLVSSLLKLTAFRMSIAYEGIVKSRYLDNGGSKWTGCIMPILPSSLTDISVKCTSDCYFTEEHILMALSLCRKNLQHVEISHVLARSNNSVPTGDFDTKELVRDMISAAVPLGTAALPLGCNISLYMDISKQIGESVSDVKTISNYFPALTSLDISVADIPERRMTMLTKAMPQLKKLVYRMNDHSQSEDVFDPHNLVTVTYVASDIDGQDQDAEGKSEAKRVVRSNLEYLHLIGNSLDGADLSELVNLKTFIVDENSPHHQSDDNRYDLPPSVTELHVTNASILPDVWRQVPLLQKFEFCQEDEDSMELIMVPHFPDVSARCSQLTQFVVRLWSHEDQDMRRVWEWIDELAKNPLLLPNLKLLVFTMTSSSSLEQLPTPLEILEDPDLFLTRSFNYEQKEIKNNSKKKRQRGLVKETKERVCFCRCFIERETLEALKKVRPTLQVVLNMCQMTWLSHKTYKSPLVSTQLRKQMMGKDELIFVPWKPFLSPDPVHHLESSQGSFYEGIRACRP